MKKKPKIAPKRGPATNLRPAGAHADAAEKKDERKMEIELRRQLQDWDDFGG